MYVKTIASNMRRKEDCFLYKADKHPWGSFTAAINNQRSLVGWTATFNFNALNNNSELLIYAL